MRKFGRKKPNREHMIRNLAVSLILFESIKTTKSKAKETKYFVDRLIARSKDETLATRRKALNTVANRIAVKKIINELIPRYKDRKSGFVRIIQLKNRLGDNAEMAMVELVDKKVFVEEPKKIKKEEATSAKGGAGTPASVEDGMRGKKTTEIKNKEEKAEKDEKAK